jgi:RNA polymerase-binding transcription factor DksA
MTYTTEYRAWTGVEWDCSLCEREAPEVETFEDSLYCEDCTYGQCIDCGFTIEDWERKYSDTRCSVCYSPFYSS